MRVQSVKSACDLVSSFEPVEKQESRATIRSPYAPSRPAVLIVAALLVLGLPSASAAEHLMCQTTVKEVLDFPRQGLVGARVLVEGFGERIWVFCDRDSPDDGVNGTIGGAECRDLLTTLHIAQKSGGEVDFNFQEGVPKDSNNPPTVALDCGEIASWNPAIGDYIRIVYTK